MVGQTSRYFCSRCDKEYLSKADYDDHQRNHPDTRLPQHKCEVCNQAFDDSLQLEEHEISTRHRLAAARCNECGSLFATLEEFNKHREWPSPCSDGRRKTPPSSDYKKRRQGQDVNFPQPASQMSTVRHVPANKTLTSDHNEVSSTNRFAKTAFDRPDTSALASQFQHALGKELAEVRQIGSDDFYCHVCQKSFISKAGYNNHFLGCTAKFGVLGIEVQYKTAPAKKNKKKKNKRKAKTGYQQEPRTGHGQGGAPANSKPHGGLMDSLHARPPMQPAAFQNPNTGAGSLSTRSNTTSLMPRQGFSTGAKPSSVAAPSNTSQIGQFNCYIGGCKKSFQTEMGLKMHQADVHSIGDRNDANRFQETPQESTLAPPQRLATTNNAHPTHRKGPLQGVNIPYTPLAAPTPQPSTTFAPHSAPGLVPHYTPQPQPQAPPAIIHSGPGVAEVDQAYELNDQMSPMMIQADILFEQDGTFTCGSQNWARILVAQQPAFMAMLNSAVQMRLPLKLQADQFFPYAKILKSNVGGDYPSAEFMFSPSPNASSTATIAAVAIVCSKVLLDNGQYEIVKIAAVDVVSCRILMDYLVYSDSKPSVKDWFTSKTGFSKIDQLEQARTSGYKVLKGWKAARAMLHKFVDKNTIIVGYDLRRDLDALRMIHGRCIDIAKMVETAAGGPLSQQQMSLQSIVRNFKGITLVANPMFGYDLLQQVFAVREMAMWALKNGDGMGKKAKALSLDYQKSSTGQA